MTTSYQVSKSTRQCAATGREIEQGETYVSVLVQPLDAEVMSRVDYSLDAWESDDAAKPDPRTTIAFWRTKMTTGQTRRPILIDDPGLVELFAALGDDETAMSDLGLAPESDDERGDENAEADAASQARLDETRRSLRFVLALLLMRKRLLVPADAGEASGGEDLVVKPRGMARQSLGDEAIVVEDPKLSDAQAAEVTMSLQKLLGLDDAAGDGAGSGDGA